MAGGDKNITVFEFGFVTACHKAKPRKDIKVISNDAFEYLKTCCLCDESDSRFLKLKITDGMEVLQVQNYVGVIFTPDRTQIEVLPKTSKTMDESEARQSLLVMLKALKQFRHIQTNSANIEKQKMPLLEVFISQFLDSVNTLVKRGLRSDYVPRTDNLAYLKGKLNIGKQLQHNLVNKHKFFCEYDEFLQDRPANRLVHAAIHKVGKFTRSARNQKLLRELSFVFHDIPLSTDHSVDFSKLKLDRGMKHYETPLEWARLILDGFSPQSMKGANSAISLLFPMEAVFESYVAAVLANQLEPGYTLRTQARSTHLVKHGDHNWFQLKPDLLVTKGSENISVLDTKWKLIDQEKNTGSEKYGLSQVDFYQMFAYGQNYLGGQGNLFLIYPYHDTFTRPIQAPFEFTDLNGKATALKLWVVPFEIKPSGSRVIWPVGSNPDDNKLRWVIN